MKDLVDHPVPGTNVTGGHMVAGHHGLTVQAPEEREGMPRPM